MAKTKVLSFKQGDDFKLDFTLTDTNHTGAISAAEALAEAKQELAELKEAEPQDQAAIVNAETALSVAQDAYDAAIILDITGWGVASQIRWCGRLIDTFNVDLSQAAIGKFTIYRDAEDTAQWKPRKYDMDIQFTRVSGKISSETFTLDVEKDVTSV